MSFGKALEVKAFGATSSMIYRDRKRGMVEINVILKVRN